MVTRPGGTSEVQRPRHCGHHRAAAMQGWAGGGGDGTGWEQKKASERNRWRVSGAELSKGPCHIRAAPVSSVAPL